MTPSPDIKSPRTFMIRYPLGLFLTLFTDNWNYEGKKEEEIRLAKEMEKGGGSGQRSRSVTDNCRTAYLGFGNSLDDEN